MHDYVDPVEGLRLAVLLAAKGYRSLSILRAFQDGTLAGLAGSVLSRGL